MTRQRCECADCECEWMEDCLDPRQGCVHDAKCCREVTNEDEHYHMLEAPAPRELQPV